VSALEPLQCQACAGPVALVEAATTPCPYCGVDVAIPAAHVTALATQRQTSATRRAAEPVWGKLSAGNPPWLAGVAVVMVVLLPPLVTLVASLVPYPPLSHAAIIAFFALPAVVPGAALYAWAGAVDATVTRFNDAMAAAPPARDKAAPGCRSCGAPLSVEPEAIAATCVYCGTDSLIEHVPQGQLTAKLRSATRTLAEGVARLRARKVMIALGIFAATILLVGSSMLIWMAVLATI
jgi:predicted RNA-binding Zn-ribbon protein involved in translation (DUF1610 family)